MYSMETRDKDVCSAALPKHSYVSVISDSATGGSSIKSQLQLIRLINTAN